MAIAQLESNNHSLLCKSYLGRITEKSIRAEALLCMSKSTEKTMSAIINQYRQLDVEFVVLNDLAKRLRTAGAKISVRKVGNIHRITMLKEPTIATVEQILGYANSASGKAIADEENQINNKAILFSNDSPDMPSSTLEPAIEGEASQPLEIATVEELKALPVKKLQELAALHKIKGRTKMNSEKLVEKLHGMVEKNQLN